MVKLESEKTEPTLTEATLRDAHGLTGIAGLSDEQKKQIHC